MRSEIIDVFPSRCGRQRLVLATEQEGRTGRNQLFLRQESCSPDVGWFVQSCIEIDPDQARALTCSLVGSLPAQGSVSSEDGPATIPFSAAVA